jgi:two-component system chemotaxis sensor kinase CheA
MAENYQEGSGSGADFDLSQFYQIFFEEAGENLDQMEQMLLNLDFSNANDEELNGIFRCAHSIKGGAATFGFSDVAELTHQMESLLDKLRRHELQPIPEMVDVLLESADASRSLLARHQAGGQGEAVSTTALVKRISDLAAGLLPTDMEVAPVRAQDASVSVRPCAVSCFSSCSTRVGPSRAWPVAAAGNSCGSTRSHRASRRYQGSVP